MRTHLVLGTLLALSFAPRAARAVENEHKLGVAGNFSSLDVKDKGGAEMGAGVAIHYSYGLTDAFNMVVEGGESIVALDAKLDTPQTPHTRPATVGSLGAGVVYTLDVTRLVPYGGALASGYWFGGGTLDHGRPELGVQLALGVDYKVTLRWSVGVGARVHFLVTDMDTYGTFTQLFGKIEYAWGR